MLYESELDEGRDRSLMIATRDKMIPTTTAVKIIALYDCRLTEGNRIPTPRL